MYVNFAEVEKLSKPKRIEVEMMASTFLIPFIAGIFLIATVVKPADAKACASLCGPHSTPSNCSPCNESCDEIKMACPLLCSAKPMYCSCDSGFCRNSKGDCVKKPAKCD